MSQPENALTAVMEAPELPLWVGLTVSEKLFDVTADVPCDAALLVHGERPAGGGGAARVAVSYFGEAGRCAVTLRLTRHRARELAQAVLGELEATE